MVKMNKRGWLKIVEAFVAIILIMAIVLVVVNNNANSKKEVASGLFKDMEMKILKDIQLNNTLRQDILDAPVNTEINDSGFPSRVRTRVLSGIPSYVSCTAKICAPSDLCILTNERVRELGADEKNVYAESILITSTLQNFNPKVLKLFCWS